MSLEQRLEKAIGAIPEGFGIFPTFEVFWQNVESESKAMGKPVPTQDYVKSMIVFELGYRAGVKTTLEGLRDGQ